MNRPLIKCLTRREAIRHTTGLAALSLAGRLAAAPESPGWDVLPGILARVKPPEFPNRDFEITQFGAAGDGVKHSTEAIGRAIERCRQDGGGRVVVPPGIFATGPIHLKSNVNLQLAAGATLRFLRDPRRYLPVVYTRSEGTERLTFRRSSMRTNKTISPSLVPALWMANAAV